MPRYGDAVDVTVPAYANFSLNACRTFVDLTDYMTDNSLFKRSDVGALAFYNSLRPISQMCQVEQIGNTMAVSNTLGEEMLPTLVDEDTLNRTCTAFLTASLRDGFGTGTGQVRPSAVAAFLPPVFRSDQSWGARFRLPSNCTCDPEVLFSLPPRQSYDPCQFQSVFDTRNNVSEDALFGCNLESNLFAFPLPLLTQPAFYEQFGIPSDVYNAFQSFATPTNNVSADDVFLSVLDTSVSAYFPGPANYWNFNTLQPGILTINYPRYYAACAPESCLVTYSSTPSAIQLITIMLGVISGLQTVLMIAVGRGYEYCFRERCDRRAAQARAARSGAARGSGSGGSTHGTDSDSDDSDGPSEPGYSVSLGQPPAAGQPPSAVTESPNKWNSQHLPAVASPPPAIISRPQAALAPMDVAPVRAHSAAATNVGPQSTTPGSRQPYPRPGGPPPL